MRRKPYLSCTGKAWERQRIFALARDNCTCQFERLGLRDGEHCTHDAPEDNPRALSVHHITERQFGGSHDLDNLITICREHHIMIHPYMRFEYAVKDKEFDAPPDKVFDAPPDREL